MCDLQNRAAWVRVLPSLLVAGLMLTSIVAVVVVAPTEITMGDAQRILYVHVSVAWFSLLAFVVMAATGMLYLWRRDLKWDAWAHAAAELGWLCSSLTLVTGSLWARSEWATWWTWDPRLTTSFVLWMIYSGCLLVRGSQTDAHRRARIGAVLANVGMLDIPLVVMATRWFRGMHPVSPQMESSMYVVLGICIVSFTLFFSMLLVRRGVQLQLENFLAGLRQQMEVAKPNQTSNEKGVIPWARS